MWSKFHRQTASNIYNWITPTILQANSSGYAVKDTRHFTYDAMGLEASHQNEHALDTTTFQNAAQAQRIINKVSIEEISKAQQLALLTAERLVSQHLNQQHAVAEISIMPTYRAHNQSSHHLTT